MSEGKSEKQYTYLKKKRWTEGEKRILLRGLKQYGSEDIQNIQQLLPQKSTTSILNMIRKYQAIAELGKKEVNSPLDVWLRSGIFDKEKNFTAEAMLFISMFEDHPPPEETAGFDLKQAYNFLYEALNGRVMTTLPQKTGEMLRDLICTRDKEVGTSDSTATTDYLLKKLYTKDSDRCYKKRKTF
ncbi:uncharacterized protein LOC100118855 isoform X2 [Nasonia vitripennis]|nr:uncharacterized protein LOC100118855 isoform X2 [Nasonia vitripennis]